ncbi:MAG: hypothetical protein AB1831_05210 [Pseudomonadota bacterium]
MSTHHGIRPGESHAPGEVAQLLSGLERQKEELGPIAEELLQLLHEMGVSESPPRIQKLNPSNE